MNSSRRMQSPAPRPRSPPQRLWQFAQAVHSAAAYALNAATGGTVPLEDCCTGGGARGRKPGIPRQGHALLEEARWLRAALGAHRTFTLAVLVRHGGQRRGIQMRDRARVLESADAFDALFATDAR